VQQVQDAANRYLCTKEAKSRLCTAVVGKKEDWMTPEAGWNEQETTPKKEAEEKKKEEAKKAAMVDNRVRL